MGKLFFGFILIFSSFIHQEVNAQNKITGESALIKQAILDSNNVTVVIYNYGSFCRPNTLGNIADFVWHGLGYMYEFGPIISAEVTDDSGNLIHITSDSYILTGQGDYSPDGTVKWGWLPRDGYANPDQDKIATSDNPSSWPASWTKWKGEYGEGVVDGLKEAIYGMDDFTNAEFNYIPDPSNISMHGLGISAEVRVSQFGGLLKNAIIITYKLKNESSKELSKIYFGFHGDPHVGGADNYADDYVGLIKLSGSPYDFANNTIYNWDKDQMGMYERKTGLMSFKFLSTPDNLGLTSFHSAVYTNTIPNVPMNDSLIWAWQSSGIDLFLTNEPIDYIVNFGTGPFTLAPGESKEVKAAIFFSDTYNDMLKDASLISYAYNWPNISSSIGAKDGNEDYKIELTSHNGGVYSGTVPITWNYSGINSNAKVVVEYSSDKGRAWVPIAIDHNLNQQLLWNTDSVKDGVNYILRLIAYSDMNKRDYFYSLSTQKFTINNSENAQPEVEFINLLADTIIKKSPLNIKWSMEDADNNNLQVAIEYSTSAEGPYTQILNNNYSAGSHQYSWNIDDVPNSDEYYLRISVSDNNSDTILVSSKFSIHQEAGIYSSGVFQQTDGTATPELFLLAVYPSEINGNTYELTFDIQSELEKKLTIKNINSGEALIRDFQFMDSISTPVFEGLKLIINDKEADIDFTKTNFNRAILDTTFVIGYPTVGTEKKTGEDWFIVFNDLDTLTEGTYKFPGDTVINQSRKNTICPFRIVSTDNFNKASYLIFENKASTRNNGIWDAGELILLQPNGETGLNVSFQVDFKFDSNVYPISGDTLKIVTYNPLTSADKFLFKADSNYILTIVNEKDVPIGYRLSQNYPNPFNPTTKIKYTIPSLLPSPYQGEGPGVRSVTLKVYDILGNEVATLVNEEKPAGEYEVELDGSKLTSGIYFYQLSTSGGAGSFVETKKMCLIK